VQPRDLLERAHDALLSWRTPGGFWEGHLSSSALSTATAVTAVAVHAGRAANSEPHDSALIRDGIGWLVAHSNPDGGWGDTVTSASNISTTLLAWAALAFADTGDRAAQAASRNAEGWIRRTAGGIDATRLSAAITARYGHDRTFSVPILTMCALAGRLGEGREAWRVIPALPFELAAAPRALFAWLRLPVVSYALPALITMGLARHHMCPSRNPAARLLRNTTRSRVLRILQGLQPSDGGFLEATPLTSFVAMSLVAAGEPDHEVVTRALRFVRASVRPDGSWPVDTHLATWVTTLAVNALHAGDLLARMDRASLSVLTRWLVAQQHTQEHVYTASAAGGWAWTPLPGGVPDADDTAGAVLALAALPHDRDATRAAEAGVEWLLRLQNSDGGIPTFCRGWGTLPFDRSGADLTAHALHAWHAWVDRMALDLRRRVMRAMDRAVGYLQAHQQPDGAFLPLWFGREGAGDEANPTYGTSRVLAALATVGSRRRDDVDAMLDAAKRWLIDARNRDGGWGGNHGVPSSIEETALAVSALSEYAIATGHDEEVRVLIAEGCRWIWKATDGGTRFTPSPIGLYFARLWYAESLYPIVFSIEALTRAVNVLEASGAKSTEAR
jgi:squalene-hopene/tetraprenyl-beta-curcumene cyclase